MNELEITLNFLQNAENKVVEFIFEKLLLERKIDFTTLSNAYVSYLKAIQDDNDNKLTEANICILESFLYATPKKCKGSEDSTQRRLYQLNQSKQFNMQSLNEKYGYDEEKAKELSWYERNKK